MLLFSSSSSSSLVLKGRGSLHTSAALLLLLAPLFLPLASSWSFRSATAEDVSFARKIMFSEAMNPLSISQETLLVAYGEEKTDKQDSSSSSPDVLGFGQIRPLNEDFSELASLYVIPEHRRQGIASSLIEKLLQRHNQQGTNPSSKICLLTLRPTTPLYEKHGFYVVDKQQMQEELPKSFQLEYAAGSLISKVLGNDLVCMVRPPI